jgi:predicted acylesterase/phospholipase RssA
MDKPMKIFNISGGATKIGGLFAKSERIIKEFGYKPDIISGVSSGALLTLPIAMGKWDELKQLVTTITLEHIFDNPPVNKKGKITLKSIWRILIGEPSFGTQNNLRKTLSNLITQNDFDKYINGKYPKVFIGVTNFNSGEFELINIQDLSYEEYLDYTVASTSIPFAVEGVEIKDKFYFDGGVYHHTCTTEIIRKYKSKISHCITVFSRPRNMNLSYDLFNQIDITQVAKQYENISTAYASIVDQTVEKELCTQYKIKNMQVFCPSVMKSLYDVDPIRLKELYLRSYNSEDKKYYIDFL